MRKLLAVFAILAGCLHANTAFSIPTGYSDSDGPVTGNVSFTLSSCVTGPSASCTLNIFITDTEVPTGGDAQLISGLSFSLMNNGIALTAPGTLSNTISNGSGGAVPLLSGSPLSQTGTTTSSGVWGFGDGKTGFYLNALTGGKPSDLIIASGSTSSNPSITGHGPSFGGTVEFSITDFLGLTSSTVLGNVDFFFGTGPTAGEGLTCGPGCTTTTIVTTTVDPVPEPVTLALAGSALLAIGLLRRRIVVK
jgi:hypothetical protein